MNDVKDFGSTGKTATLKTDHTKPLKIGGMVEGIQYKIVKINNPCIEIKIGDEDPPLVGESISIEYDFKPDEGCSFGYEHLCLIICRLHKNGRNYVKYFRKLSDLELFMKGMEVEIDKTYAKNRIKELKNDIKKLERDYNLKML